MSSPNWSEILRDARGYLGLGDDDPVPVDELLAQAEANGYDEEKEARDALREADELEAVGDLDDLHVRLADGSSGDETAEEDTDIEGENPGCGGEESPEDDLEKRSLEAFAAAIEFFNSQLDRDISDAFEDAPDTPRAYYTEHRGWDEDTIADKQLGYAPADERALLDYLMREGFDGDAIQGTGLFYEDFTPHFQGRYVLPYFDADGRPVYAISRSLNAHEDGHPHDPKGDQKYTKAIKTKDRTCVDEPIYGRETVDDDTDRLLVAGGIADALTLHEAGYACISPVTTVRFKNKHEARVVDLVDEHDIDGVYMLNDAERPSVDKTELEDSEEAESIGQVLTIKQYGEGQRAAFGNAEFLLEENVDPYLAELPGGDDYIRKLDPDDYIKEHWGSVETLLANADHAQNHDSYNAWSDQRRARQVDKAIQTGDASGGGESETQLYSLTFPQVSGMNLGDRQNNPLGHHGDSEGYFVCAEKQGLVHGYDHKYNVAYNAISFLLCDAGERRADDPNGRLSDYEVFVAWKHAKANRHLPENDPVPYRALRGVAVEDALVEREELVERDSDTGEIVDDTDTEADTYTALPSGIYNDLLDHVREEYDVDPGRDAVSGGDSREEADHRTDPRERDATVDMRRAWDAAGRVTPDELEADLALGQADDGEAWIAANGDRVGDVVRAVALDAGMIDTADDDLDDYPAAYNRAREEYGAPIPRYYTTADAIAEFDAVLDVIGEVTYWDLDVDAFASDVTEEGDEVDGDAVRALNPSWRESESEASVIVFDSGTVWDADTERVIDAVRFVALDSGLIESPEEPLEGEDFTEAYARARTEYAAPLPRWEPAADGQREITPQLPPAEDLLDTFEYDDGVDTDALEAAREDVEDLVGELVEDTGAPSVITSLPATGKTTGTIKTARDRPLSYLAPRKELQAQALDKAEEWGVNAEILPVYCDETIRDDVLDAAIQHVRSAGKDRLRDRWAILTTALEAAGDDSDVGEIDPEDIFADEEEADGEAVDLDRPTCETARGDHGVAWALVVHIARALGYTPREIHQHAEGLFGASLPCDAGEATCEYTDGWDTVADPDRTLDLLVGSYVHAHVESVRTAYSRDQNGDIERTPRSIVLDEFPGEAFVREFDGEAVDHATWLARSLVDHVDDRRDMRAAQLHRNEWVRAWLDGTVDTDSDDETVRRAAITAKQLQRRATVIDEAEEVVDLFDTPAKVLDRPHLLENAKRIANDPEGLAQSERREAVDELRSALNQADRKADLPEWLVENAHDALDELADVGEIKALEHLADLPVGGEFRTVVDRAAERSRPHTLQAASTALLGGREGCRQLAAWADDGYAHPDAHHLLEADMTPTGERETVDVDDLDSGQRIYTDSWAFDENATEGTVVDRVETGGKATVVADRNDHGALLHTPPSRQSGGGEEAALVGLDATGRAELWATALGEEVDTEDIHTTPGERAEFLESALGLRVIQAADRPRPYEGDPTTKDTDGDVALLETIADEYSGIEAPRSRDEGVDAVGKPAAITTKGVRDVLENDTRLDDVVAEFENYGNVTGANDLGDHRLAAILGSQHYGDHAIERFCALGGEEVDTSRDAGRGAALDYGNDLANTYLKHMREDQTMQAALRFARGDSGATIVARTSALREDLPVVGRGQVVETWSDTATEIARRYRRLGGRFSIGDVADAVDVTKRQVRRVLAELTEAGYLRRVEAGDGIASVYESATAGPGAGEVDLPERADAVDSEPGHSASNEYYTWNVRVSTLSEGVIGDDTAEPSTALGAPPSPAVATGERGPQSGGEGRPI